MAKSHLPNPLYCLKCSVLMSQFSDTVPSTFHTAFHLNCLMRRALWQRKNIQERCICGLSCAYAASLDGRSEVAKCVGSMQLQRVMGEKMEVTSNFDDLAERDKKATLLSQESSPTPTRRCIRPSLETSAALSQTPARDSQDTAANYKPLAIYIPISR